jgi:hypothetical protein
MSNLPPFDQPFQPISAEYGRAMLEFENSGRTLANPGQPSVPASGTKTELFFLVVPFAEKDEAKALGARWEAKARKWYVPAGKDKDLFKRWWAAT